MGMIEDDKYCLEIKPNVMTFTKSMKKYEFILILLIRFFKVFKNPVCLWLEVINITIKQYFGMLNQSINKKRPSLL